MRQLLIALTLSSAALAQTPMPAANSPSTATVVTKDLSALAKELTQQLADKKFDEVEKHFDKQVAAGLPVDKLAQTWASIVSQLGAFQSISGASSKQEQGYQVVLVTTKFENTAMNLKWVFDKEGQVAGFFIVPVS